jgi:hypothetical protein
VISAGFEGQDMRYLAVTGLINPVKVNTKPKISMPPRPKASPDDKTDTQPNAK